MPELPEVHTISSDLNKHISGYKIAKAEVLGNYLTFPSNKEFCEQVVNTEIERVGRVAKNIIFHLSNKNIITVHLAMTGQVLLKSPKDKVPSWTRVVLALTKNTDTKMLYLTDMRMFGKIGVYSDVALTSLKNKYGPEPLQETDAQIFLSNLKKHRTTIKNALLDQETISGLGNIYATDALFIAKIHPETSTIDMTLDAATRLLQASKTILEEGILHRGSTLGDKMYIDIFGKEGTHQLHFRIYSKTTCPECHNKVDFKKINGRGTYFCAVCQTNPKQQGLF